MKKFLVLVAVVVFVYFGYNEFFETETTDYKVFTEIESDSSIVADTTLLDTIPKDTTNK